MSIPLNYFNRVSTLVTTTSTAIYTAPFQRAGIVIAALATNLTTIPQSITVGISSTGVPGSYYTILNNFLIPPNDSTNLVVGKLVLTYNDTFIVSTANSNAANITLSILETANTGS